MRYYNDSNEQLKSREIVSMSYAYTAFAIGVSFLFWFAIHEFNLLANETFVSWSSIILLPMTLACIVLGAITNVSSGIVRTAIYYFSIMITFGAITALTTETVMINTGSPVVLAAAGSTFVVFLLTSIIGHRSKMNVMARDMIMQSLSIFTMSVIFMSLVVGLFFRSHFDIIDLFVTYLTVPFTIFYLFYTSNLIKQIAEDGINVSNNKEGATLTKIRLSLICASHLFVGIVSLFLKLLRIFADANKRR